MTNKTRDGIYESRSHGEIWSENRRVYIQNGTVRLVDYKASVMTEEEAKAIHTFGFNSFFSVNTLGPRVSDLPENFNIFK